MQDAHRAERVDLKKLITKLKDGSYVIPDFQRDFEWDPSDINALIRSVFLDYFIGSLLLWRGQSETFDAFSCEPIWGFSGNQEPNYIVLDGQQRLTALYYAIVSPETPPPKRKNRFLYFIRIDEFMQQNFDRAFEYDWTNHAVNLATDREKQFEKHWFPLAVIGRGGWELASWMMDYQKHWESKAKDLGTQADSNVAEMEEATKFSKYAVEFSDHIRNVTENYQVSYIELDRDLGLEKICDIFTQINSRGVRLNVFDLMNAMLKPKGLQLKYLWRKSQDKYLNLSSKLNISNRMNVYVLQIMSILKQSYCSPDYIYYLIPSQVRRIRESDGSTHDKILIDNIEEFQRFWDRAVTVLNRSISLLLEPSGFGAVTPAYLPYASILPVFSALQEILSRRVGPRRMDADRKIWQWYWASIFTNRYSGSFESKSAQDFRDISKWIDDNDAQPRMINEFHQQIESLDLKGQANSNTAIFKAVLNLMILQGPLDWQTGRLPNYADVQSHYIVPRNWFSQIGHDVSPLLDSVINRTLITSETSRAFVGDRMPNEYLKELLEENDRADVLQILETHCISQEALDVLLKKPFTLEDFETFLTIRSRTIREHLRDLLDRHQNVSEEVSRTKAVQLLENRIRGVEVALRDLICRELNGKIENLPSDVRVVLEDRLRGEKRRNPSVTNSRIRSLDFALSFATLRDLEQIFKNKQKWMFFKRHLRNKEELAKRFAQVINLRNAICHIRQMDEFTRTDGEAGTIWFEKILKLDADT